jgi:DNA repair exonuclease SbcCD ATPase subunit
MDAARKSQLIRRRSVAKASVTRMQNFIEYGDLKVNEIKARLDKLPSILSKYESAQDELECLDEIDDTLDREEFETQYYQVEAKFNELLHLVVEFPQPRNNFSSRSSSRSRNTTPRSHGSRVNIKLPFISLPHYEGKHETGFSTETHLKH